MFWREYLSTSFDFGVYFSIKEAVLKSFLATYN